MKEEQIRTICHTLCSNISKNVKESLYTSNLGLKAIIEAITRNSLENQSHVLKEIMNYFINNILDEQLKTPNAINIIIFMLTKPVKNNSTACPRKT